MDKKIGLSVVIGLNPFPPAGKTMNLAIDLFSYHANIIGIYL